VVFTTNVDRPTNVGAALQYAAKQVQSARMGATNFEAVEVKVTSTKGHILAIGTACVQPSTPSQRARCCDCVGKHEQRAADHIAQIAHCSHI
jgi:hypothetical protein